MIRVASRCRTVDELVAAFATRVDEESILVLTDQVYPVGARMPFTIELGDGTIAMAGEAEVLEARQPPRGPGQLKLQLLALDAAGRLAHQRMLDRKNAAVVERPPTVRPPTTPPQLQAPSLIGAARQTRPNTAIPVTPPPPKPRGRTPRPPPPSEPLLYDVDQMIALMRRLPDGDVATAMRALRATLASVGVSLPPVIEDAQRRQADLEDRIALLEREIDERNQEVEQRMQELARLDADFAETSLVRERLELATGARTPRR